MNLGDHGTISLYLASQGFVTGSFVTMKISELASGSGVVHSDFTSLQLKEDDIICAATALDLELSDMQQSYLITLIRGLCSGFQFATVLLNNVVHRVGKNPKPLATAQPHQPLAPVFRGPSEELVVWVRLQLYMKNRLEINQQPIPMDFFLSLRRDSNVAKHPQVLALASTLLSPKVCWHLSPFFSKPGCIFEFPINDVVKFFSVVVHGYDSLHSKDYNLIQQDKDTFLTSVIDCVQHNIQRIKKLKLRDLISTIFEPYASHFDYLIVTVTNLEVESFTLYRDSSRGCTGTWKSPDGRWTIDWGNNWSVIHDNVRIAEKVVNRSVCIPFLSCLQNGGNWVVKKHCRSFSVGLGSSQDFVTCDVPTGSSSASSAESIKPMLEHQSIRRSPEFSTVDQQLDHRSELHMTLNIKRQKLEVPHQSLYSFLSPFLSWDPILNVFDSLESVSVSVLQELLERCLWFWAGRNDEYEEMHEFYTSAIESLKVYEGKGCVCDPAWEIFFCKYGCFETPRLWTLTERLMLMVACSWPFYLWDNIDQKNSNESATLRIRGMAVLHPRFTSFLRSRMLDFGFINDVDFPLNFSHFSAVNICSNVCKHGLSRLDYSNFFLIDFSFSPSFLLLTGCSKDLNADGLYAATSVTVNGSRVYAIVNSDMRSKLGKCSIFFQEYTDPLLDQPTVILVTVLADGVPRLESVKFAFALHLQEFIIMRNDDEYKRFFTVSCNDDAFIYVRMSSPVLAAVSFNFSQAKYPSLSFSYGYHYVAVPDPLDGMIKNKKQLKFLTDQGRHFDGNPNPPSFLDIQVVPVFEKLQSHDVRMYGLVVPAAGTGGKRTKSSDQLAVTQPVASASSSAPSSSAPLPPVAAAPAAVPTSPAAATTAAINFAKKWVDQTELHHGVPNLNHRTVSRSALYAVFHDTFIGVKLGRRTVYIKIKDGCAFLFSFWFEHFGVGTVKWHFRPHSYFHSKDIRHFPVDTPEQFFVFLAAVKLARMCKDALSQAAFELLILRTLNTFQDSDADPLPSVFSGLDGVVVKDSIGDFYSLLSHDTVVNRQTCNESQAKKSKTNPSEMQQVETCDAVATFVGLRNTRALCGFNSLVQAWFHIIGFRNAVLLSESVDASLYELKTLFYFLQIGSTSDCHANEFSLSPCFETLEPGVHHDVEEIFTLFSCRLSDVHSHFEGTIARRTCVSGFEPSEVSEQFCLLSLGLSDSVESSMQAFFETTHVPDFNAGTTKNPNRKPADSKYFMITFPSILHVQLKRFSVKGKGRNFNFRKNCARCTFSPVLDFAELIPDSIRSSSPKYSLQSVLVHTGTKKSGHYIVFIRPDITSKPHVWFRFDDDHPVVQVSEAEAIDANFGFSGGSDSECPTAYMLIYVMDSVIRAPCVDVSKMSQNCLVQAHFILQNISKLPCHFSGDLKCAEHYLLLFENYVGVLSSIFRVVSSDPSSVPVLSRVPSACLKLQMFVDSLPKSVETKRKQFIKRSEKLALLCENLSSQNKKLQPVLSTAVTEPRPHTLPAEDRSFYSSISVSPYIAAFSCADTHGNIYVSCVHPDDAQPGQIQVFQKDNFKKSIRAYTNIGNHYGGFVLDKSGRPVVADIINHCIRIYSDDGTSYSFGSKGKGDMEFRRPSSVALDTDGNVVVHDSGNNRLKVHCIVDGSFVRTVYKQKESLGAGCVVFDNAGNLVFSDPHCIRVLDYKTLNLIHQMPVSNSVTFLIGGREKRLALPGGLAIDNSGHIFMLDLKSNLLRVYKGGKLINSSNIPIFSESVNVQEFQKIWDGQHDEGVINNLRVVNVAIRDHELMYCYRNTVFFCPKPGQDSLESDEVIDVSDADVGSATLASDTHVSASVPFSATLNALQSAASMNEYLCDAAISMTLSCFEIMAPSICGYDILFVPPLISWQIINNPSSQSIIPYKDMVRACSLCVFVTGLGDSYKSYGKHWLLHFYDIVQKKCFCWDPTTERCGNEIEYRRVSGPISSFLGVANFTPTVSDQTRVQFDSCHCGVWVLLYICHFMFNGHKQLKLTVGIETARRALASDLKNHRFCLDKFISCVVLPPEVLRFFPRNVPHTFWHELPVTSMENYLLLKYKESFGLQCISRNRYIDAADVGSSTPMQVPRLVSHYRGRMSKGIVTVFHLGLLVEGKSPAGALSSMYDIALAEACSKNGSFGIIAIGSTCSWVHVCLPICIDEAVFHLRDVQQQDARDWTDIFTRPIPGPSNRDSTALNRHLAFIFNQSVGESRWNTLIFSWNLNVFKGCLSPVNKSLKLAGLKKQVGFTQPFLEMIRCKVDVVEDADMLSECLSFIRDNIDNNNPISIDTERSAVVPNSKEPIDLLQVGAHDRVFLIRVNWCASEMLRELLVALSNCSALCHWGGQDDVKLKRLCDYEIEFKFKNVQDEYSAGGSKIGLLTAAFNEFQPYFTRPPGKADRVLEQDWTISGWNIPSLTPEQIGYAGLDVAVLNLITHQLLLNPVFERSDKYTGFLDASGAHHWHGCENSDSTLLVGHFQFGQFEKGFKKQENMWLVYGFRIGSCTNLYLDDSYLQSMITDYFCLLNQRKFCCHWCSIIIDTNIKSAPIKFAILKMQLTDTRFTADQIERRCHSQCNNLKDCASWLCFAAVSELFNSADVELPSNFLSLVSDDVKSGFLRLSLSHLSQPFLKRL
jgi:hypothetical protein